MSERLRRALPLAAVVAGALALAALACTWWDRGRALEDTGQTRQTVEAEVARLTSRRPAGLEDPAFLGEAAGLARSRYVVYVWLVDASARVVFSSGGRARAGASAEALATPEMRQVLEELPPGGLSPALRLSLLVASALQAEGEHNDVFRHLVREVAGPDGSLRGVVGVTYEVSPAVGRPPLGMLAGVLGFAVSFVTYWLTLAAWVYLDARRSGERAVPWTALVLLGNLVALIAYLLVRRPVRRA
ncbi:MAG: hypothetical protein K6T75_10650 [Acetobacteraceae bacterium]|nr:hypothetical protein [Acetobacteraceae bacterium]